MYKPLPENAQKNQGIQVSAWIPVPDAAHCAMRIVEGTDRAVVANRVAFIEKTPRVRFQPFDNPSDDWKNWHQGWKGEDGWDVVAQGWCDAHLQTLGYVVPDARPYDDSMLD